ncbi:hypothetical protein AcV7_000054 [Taiwanofungus camphoratus]|nr:hypothetical protein AcV7_000054 [Antrodia cinnamomea]
MLFFQPHDGQVARLPAAPDLLETREDEGGAQATHRVQAPESGNQHVLATRDSAANADEDSVVAAASPDRGRANERAVRETHALYAHQNGTADEGSYRRARQQPPGLLGSSDSSFGHHAWARSGGSAFSLEREISQTYTGDVAGPTRARRRGAVHAGRPAARQHDGLLPQCSGAQARAAVLSHPPFLKLPADPGAQTQRRQGARVRPRATAALFPEHPCGRRPASGMPPPPPRAWARGTREKREKRDATDTQPARLACARKRAGSGGEGCGRPRARKRTRARAHAMPCRHCGSVLPLPLPRQSAAPTEVRDATPGGRFPRLRGGRTGTEDSAGCTMGRAALAVPSVRYEETRASRPVRGPPPPLGAFAGSVQGSRQTAVRQCRAQSHASTTTTTTTTTTTYTARAGPPPKTPTPTPRQQHEPKPAVQTRAGLPASDKPARAETSFNSRFQLTSGRRAAARRAGPRRQRRRQLCVRVAPPRPAPPRRSMAITLHSPSHTPPQPACPKKKTHSFAQTLGAAETVRRALHPARGATARAAPHPSRQPPIPDVRSHGGTGGTAHTQPRRARDGTGALVPRGVPGQ